MPEVPVDYGHLTALISLTGDQELMSVSIGMKFTDGDVILQPEVDAYSGLIGTFIKGSLVNSYTYEGCNLFVGTGLGDRSWDSANGVGACTRSGNAAPQNTAILVKKSTGFAGRKNRGRMYLPGPEEGQVSPTGEVTPAEVTRIQNLLNTFSGAILLRPEVEDLVILHSYGDATIPTVITAMSVDGIIATQRRRLRR